MNKPNTLHAAGGGNVKITGKADPAKQETVRQAAPKDAMKAPFSKIPVRNSADTPLIAAKGDDDMMSQPQRKS